MATKIVIPDEDFSANAIYQEGDEPTPITELVNGYATRQNTTIVEVDITASSNLIRVRTGELFGKFYVKTNEGFVIRAIIYYNTSIDLSTAGTKTTSGATNASNVQGLSEYTFNTADKYAIITFCKTDATQPISASEDIVAELYYIED
jgi:hypothetical protein